MADMDGNAACGPNGYITSAMYLEESGAARGPGGGNGDPSGATATEAAGLDYHHPLED